MDETPRRRPDARPSDGASVPRGPRHFTPRAEIAAAFARAAPDDLARLRSDLDAILARDEAIALRGTGWDGVLAELRDDEPLPPA